LAKQQPQGVCSVNNAQAILQRALQTLDPWLDAAFPIATALICARQRLAGYSLLVVYLLLRLLQRSDRESWRWILISLLVVNAGLIIQDQDIKPGGPSDYLIIALSFSAGYKREWQQWKISAAWISSCAAPLLLFSLAAGDAMIQGNSSFAGFNINKLGFLSGLLTVSSYGLIGQLSNRRLKYGALLLLALSCYASILTESRASIALPAIVICADLLRRVRWTALRASISIAACCLVLIATTYSWYSDSSTSGNSLSDTNRISTITCWVEAPFRTQNTFAFGYGFGNATRKICGPDKIPSLTTMGKSEGLSHAHNLYAQIFNEAGAPGLLLGLAITAAALREGWELRNQRFSTFIWPVTLYIFLMALGITYWQVMMINQVLVGYSLAALTAMDRDPAAADATIPTAPPGASATPG